MSVFAPLLAPRYLPLIVSAIVFPLSLYQSIDGEGPGWWLVAGG